MFDDQRHQFAAIGQAAGRTATEAAQREREVPATINRVTGAAVNLQDLVSQLAKRLAPVCATRPQPAEDRLTKQPFGTTTELAQAMQPALGSLAMTTEAVQRLLEELEV